MTGPIRRTAAMIAGHGYVVAVPEVYHELEATGAVLDYLKSHGSLGRDGHLLRRAPCVSGGDESGCTGDGLFLCDRYSLE